MLIPTKPDFERIKSLLKMVEVNMERIETTDIQKFASQVTKEYFEVIRELMSIILMLDGFKTYGEFAHKETISYLSNNYAQFTNDEIQLAEDLSTIRNKVSYDGFFVNNDYLRRNQESILNLISKLKNIINQKRGQ